MLGGHRSSSERSDDGDGDGKRASMTAVWRMPWQKRGSIPDFIAAAADFHLRIPWLIVWEPSSARSRLSPDQIHHPAPPHLLLMFLIQDRVNCPFFHKVGACRHGDRCNRLHHKPLYSQTVLIPHMWTAPQVRQSSQPLDLLSVWCLCDFRHVVVLTAPITDGQFGWFQRG